MNKKFIAITAAMMVLTGSMAFAASNVSNTQMPMHQNHYAQQHNASYDQHARHNQHMYQLSDRAKTNSSSMWDSVCNFFGMHGGHGSHGGHNGGRHM